MGMDRDKVLELLREIKEECKKCRDCRDCLISDVCNKNFDIDPEDWVGLS